MMSSGPLELGLPMLACHENCKLYITPFDRAAKSKEAAQIDEPFAQLWTAQPNVKWASYVAVFWFNRA